MRCSWPLACLCRLLSIRWRKRFRFRRRRKRPLLLRRRAKRNLQRPYRRSRSRTADCRGSDGKAGGKPKGFPFRGRQFFQINFGMSIAPFDVHVSKSTTKKISWENTGKGLSKSLKLSKLGLRAKFRSVTSAFYKEPIKK